MMLHEKLNDKLVSAWKMEKNIEAKEMLKNAIISLNKWNDIKEMEKRENDQVDEDKEDKLLNDKKLRNNCLYYSK